MTLLIYMFLPETKRLPLEQMEQVWRSHWFWKKIVREVEDKEGEEKEHQTGKIALPSS